MLGFVQAIYGTFAQIMETRVKALTTLLSALEAFCFVCANSAFLNKSQHFTVHLFRPGRPGSARGSDGGPRWFTAVVYPRPRLQRPVASEDEASACSELRLGCHPETPVIKPYPVDLWETRARPGRDFSNLVVRPSFVVSVGSVRSRICDKIPRLSANPT